MEWFFYVFAGLGAGIITGLAGLTAALVITPVLFAFCGWDSFDAVTVALAADVPASLLSALTYHKSGNIDIKRGGAVTITAFLGSVLGSFCGLLFHQVQPNGLGWLSLISTVVFGFRFMLKPITGGTEVQADINTPEEKRRIFIAMGLGVLIGWVCGFCGSGGGLLMLSVFVLVLRYNMKIAVGTSTMVMTAVALTGAVSHFAMGATLHLLPSMVIIGSCLVGSVGAARFANRVDNKVLNRTVGIMLILLGLVTILFKLI